MSKPFKDDTEEEYKDLVMDIRYDKEQFKDPATIGLLLYRLSKEREKSNELFEKILTRLESIEKTISSTNKVSQPGVLADIDNQIITYIKGMTLVDAEEVQKRFGYKGKNAASARLNALFDRGLLSKTRAGKKVKYWAGNEPTGKLEIPDEALGPSSRKEGKQ